MILYYLRHGDPIYDPDSLTALGHEQARALAKRLALYGIDEIYSSDSNRAMQTSQPTCDLLKKKKTLCHWANENVAWSEFTVLNEEGKRKWGFQHKPTTDFFNSSEIRDLGGRWYEHPFFEGTNFKAGALRVHKEVDDFLLSLGYRHDREGGYYEAVEPNEKRIALFAHQGFGMAFLSSLLDTPYPHFCTHFDLSHSSMTVIKFSGEGKIYPQILQLSNDSHLYREGLLTGYNNGTRI